MEPHHGPITMIVVIELDEPLCKICRAGYIILLFHIQKIPGYGRARFPLHRDVLTKYISQIVKAILIMTCADI